MRNVQHISVTKNDLMGGTKHEHPAFGQIGASRVSGSASLYDSDFNHQNYITITICKSTLHRSLSNDWHFGGKELIEVALSESQWATFVSSMNVGSGVPCTLRHIGGAPVPYLPDPEPRTEQFSSEVAKNMAEALEALDALKGSISESVSAKKKFDDLSRAVERIKGMISSSTEFVAGQFDEHMERTVERAKVEVNAYVTSHVQRAGLEALGVAPIALLDNHKAA